MVIDIDDDDYYYYYDDDDGDDGDDDDDDGDDVGRLVATLFFLLARTRIVRTDFQFYQSSNPNYPRAFCVNGSTGLLEKQHTQSHTHHLFSSLETNLNPNDPKQKMFFSIQSQRQWEIQGPKIELLGWGISRCNSLYILGGFIPVRK